MPRTRGLTCSLQIPTPVVKPMPRTRGLTPRQQVFVRKFLVDLNGSQAAIRAGYSPRAANREASRLLPNVDISAAIQAAQAARLEIDADWVLRRLVENVNRAMTASNRGGAFASCTGGCTSSPTTDSATPTLRPLHLRLLAPPVARRRCQSVSRCDPCGPAPARRRHAWSGGTPASVREPVPENPPPACQRAAQPGADRPHGLPVVPDFAFSSSSSFCTVSISRFLAARLSLSPAYFSAACVSASRWAVCSAWSAGTGTSGFTPVPSQFVFVTGLIDRANGTPTPKWSVTRNPRVGCAPPPVVSPTIVARFCAWRL